MKICIPIVEDCGLDSKVNPHFGSAPAFFIYDADQECHSIVVNDDHAHQHGMCQPATAIQGLGIDAVVCTGMGLRAIQRLNQAGVKVFRTAKSSITEIVNEFDLDLLPELTAKEACMEHDCE